MIQSLWQAPRRYSPLLFLLFIAVTDTIQAILTGASKRNRRKGLGCGAIALMIVGLNLGVPAARADRPFLGAYVHLPSWFQRGMDNAARHRAIIDNLDRFEQSGLNVLIPFVTTTQGQALYPSERIPGKIWSDWDPLAVIVPEAHRRGLKVYTSVCVLAAGHNRPAGILKSHPEWALRDKDGQPLGFISPANPGACRWVVSVVEEIAERYRPDGILLDYCRYPGSEAKLDPAGQAKFEAAYPADRFPPGGRAYKKAFLEYRRNTLTHLVGQISGALHSLKPAPRLAAYVWGVHEFKKTRDWGDWLSRGYLDMLNLTGYSYREQYGDKYMEVLDKRFVDAEAVFKQLDKPVEFTIGVGIDTSHGKIRAAREVEDYLQIGLRHGVQGATIFTWESLQPYLPEIKKAGYFKRFAQEVGRK